MPLNENNIQAPFQYKIGENTFELLERNGELELNTNNVQVKVFSGQRLFCADIGYAVDGPLENMEFLIDDIKVYPQLLENLKDLQTVDVKDNEIYLVNNDINVKLQRRPCLILDDGRGLIVEEDNRNFHVLKLTTQYDRYKRKLIKDWKKIGLAKKSYIRIEMPIKIEKAQFERKIAKLQEEELMSVYNEVYNIINTEALAKISKKYKESKKEKVVA